MTRPVVCSAVKALRLQMRASQVEFASHLGVSLSAVGKYETTYTPSRSMLVRFRQMSEERGLTVLVGVFSEALKRPIYEVDGITSELKLQTVERCLSEARSMLLTTYPITKEHSQRLKRIGEELTSLTAALQRVTP